MIIDFHTHILPESFRERREELLRRDSTFRSLFRRLSAPIATAEDLIRAMDEDSIERSIVMGYGWCDPEIARESNDYLLHAASKYPTRITPLCSVHPGWGDLALREIERCSQGGAVGIGELHPTSQNIDIASDNVFNSLMRMAEELGLFVVVHGSEPIGHAYPGKGNVSIQQQAALAQNFPNTKIIFAHWGGGLFLYSLMPEIRQILSNVYFDTAASPLLYDRHIFPVAGLTLGNDHILLGSDFPLIRPRRVIEQARSALNPGEFAEIAWNNGQRLLRES